MSDKPHPDFVALCKKIKALVDANGIKGKTRDTVAFAMTWTAHDLQPSIYFSGWAMIIGIRGYSEVEDIIKKSA